MTVEQEATKELSTEHLSKDLRGRSVRGGLLNLTSQGTQFLIQTAATVILARLLTPADFGLVAMVATVTGLAQAFADLGLSEATIQREEISQDQVSSLFWVNVAVGLGLMILTMALSPLIARFYHDGRLTKIALLSSLNFLFGGLRVQPDALLKRQMRFLALAIRDVSSYGVAVPIAIILAWQGAGYWSIVALPLLLNFTQMWLSWLMIKWRPSRPRWETQVGSLVAFGGNVAVSYFIVTVSRSADTVLIGWYTGVGPLGLYSRAYNLLMLPVRQFIVPAGSVAIPAFSRLQEYPERFAHYYLRAVNLILWISAPIFAFLFVAARPVIVLLLGQQWQEAAPVFQLLAISALVQVFLEPIIWLHVSRGRSTELLKLLVIICPILIASYAVGLPFGIKGVALTGSLVQVAMLPWVLRISFRTTELNLRRFGQAVLYPISLCLIAIFFAELAKYLIAPKRLLSEILVVAAAFLLTLLFSSLVPTVQREIASLRQVFREFRPTSSAVQTSE